MEVREAPSVRRSLSDLHATPSRCIHQDRSAYSFAVCAFSNDSVTLLYSRDILIFRIVLPKEWRDTMQPLQDRCDPTPYEDIEALFLSDIGKPVSELFESFDPLPIGVASLAQVHVGKHKETGKEVAVKVHPEVVLVWNCPRP